MPLEVCLAVAISARYWSSAPAGGPLEALFLPLSAAGHWASAAVILLVVALPLVAGLREGGVALAALAGAALVTLLVADTAVFRTYHFHVDPFFLGMLVMNGGSGFFDFSARTLTEIVACFALSLVGQVGIAWLARRLVARARWPWAGLVVGLGLLGAIAGTHGVHAWASATGHRGITQLGELLPGFRGLTANTWLRAHGYAVHDMDAVALDAPSGRLRYPRAPLVCPGAPLPDGTTRPDIVLVVIESWRADALRPDVMPATAALAAESLSFTRHYSSGNSTQPGLGGLLYGIPATYWESIASADGAGGPAIVQAAEALDYRFGAFSSPDTLQRLRFDRYFFGALPADRLTLRENDGRKYDSDAASAEQLSTFLAAGGEPAFALIFFDSTHHRYVFPPDYPARFSPRELADIPSFDAETDPLPYRNQYLNAAGYVDTLVARVLNGIEAGGRAGDTIVVITGDHGEAFNDAGRGDWGHGLDYGEVQTHVPLVVRWPGHAAGPVDHVTEHADVTASLLHDALGCENPLGDYTTGLGLFDPGARPGRVVAGYVGYGIVTRSEIVSNTAGFVHVTERDLAPKLSVDDAEGFQRGVEQMSAFYR